MRSRPLLLLALVALLVALALPGAAQALELKIENKSNVPEGEVWVTVYTANPSDFEVPGFERNVPRTLESIPGHTLTIDKLISGRIYVSYGAGTSEPIDFHSPTRFDWIELTLTPSPGDVANLTAVEQFGIGMRLNTYGTSDEPLEELGSANANTIFDALQAVPGGPAATVRNGAQILRVLSPLQSNAYPDLGEYVRSMAGKTIDLHSTFSGPASGNFATSAYSGTFGADGSIVLTGTYERNSSAPEATAPHEISMPGPELIENVYSGKGTPNNLEGQIKHDVLVGFMAGYWDGRYGNDAIGFCTNANTGGPQSFCPTGFNQPAFGDARAALSPFPTCEQYAAVINKYADMYGNPYSDGASGKVTIPIVKSGVNDVKTLKLTILPDEGDAQPVAGGNADCGAGSSPTPAGGGSTGGEVRRTARTPRVAVHTRLFKRAHLLRHGRLRVARVACGSACGRVRALVRKGKRVLARALVKRAGRKQLVVAHLTKPGRGLLRHHRRLKARLDLWVTPPGRRATHHRGGLLLLR
jgi:hypothetical protein